MTLALGGLRLAGLALLLALVGAALPALAQPRFPALTGRVTDAANILPPRTEAELTQRLVALETSTGRQLVVATVPSLQDYEIDEFANQLFRAWRLGDRTRNDGALLLVAPTERKVRIEVGYGLEGVLTDALSSVIIREQVLTRARAGDLPGGVVAGADAVIAQLRADPELASQRNMAAATERREEGGGSVWPILLTLLIVFMALSFIGGLFGRGRRGRRRNGSIVFGSGLGGGGWSGGGGSFGGGGGGFSGGGGSSGGGGASGGW